MPTDNRFTRHGPLRIAPDARHFQHDDATPFTLLADTAWSGPMKATLDDWRHYLKYRARQGFTGIMFILPAPWRACDTDREGHASCTTTGGFRIHDAYFDRMDAFLQAILDADLLPMPVLAWANQPGDPGIDLEEQHLIDLIDYELSRYVHLPALWMLAGDGRYEHESAERWKRIGRKVFDRHPASLVTMHPAGLEWYWDDWADETWMTVLGYQSGHGDDQGTLRFTHSGPPCRAWHASQGRPVLNLEPNYEDFPGYNTKRRHDAYTVRRATWWTRLTAPGPGIGYGAQGLWSWEETIGEPAHHPGSHFARTWREALEFTGADHAALAARLWHEWAGWTLSPDANLVEPWSGHPGDFIAAASRDDQAVCYLPLGGTIRVQESRLSEFAHATWLCPRTGHTQSAAHQDGAFNTPGVEDWVLVLTKERA